MESWTDPGVVARFRWRLKVYWIALAIGWSGVPLFVLALLSDTTRAQAGMAIIAPAGIMLLIVWIFWRCPNCKGELSSSNNYISGVGVSCRGCGAALYEPGGRYDTPSPPRKPTSPPDDSSDVDAMAEAEVYVEHGFKVQAIKVLQEALQSRPARADIAKRLAELQGQLADKR
jgi:hypothetical protein